MKKLLLSVLALCAGIAAQAQTSVSEGYHPEFGYAMDFVTTDQNIENVYWWEQSKDTTVTVRVDSLVDNLSTPPCTTFRAPYVYNWKRVPQTGSDLTSGYVDYTMNQTYGNYEPVGVGFGEGKVLDISKNNAYLGFKFKNTSAVKIVLQVGLQDSSKNIINSMVIKGPAGFKPATIDNSYLEQISFTINPGASIDTILDFNKSRYPDYTPYYPEYAKDACFRSLKSTTAKPNPTRLRNFNYEKLYAVTFTVVSTTRTYDFEDSYKPNSLRKASFQISKFRVGTPLLLAINDEESLSSNNIFSVYPNPVNNGVLNLNMVAQNIKVLDVLGNVVISSASAKEVNVSSLNKGVYTLQSSKGTSRFVVE